MGLLSPPGIDLCQLSESDQALLRTHDYEIVETTFGDQVFIRSFLGLTKAVGFAALTLLLAPASLAAAIGIAAEALAAIVGGGITVLETTFPQAPEPGTMEHDITVIVKATSSQTGTMYGYEVPVYNRVTFTFRDNELIATGQHLGYDQ